MKKVKVNKDDCIGCGACQAIAPDVFEINKEGYAEAITGDIPEELVGDVIDAIEGCPTGAIVEVEEAEEK